MTTDEMIKALWEYRGSSVAITECIIAKLLAAEELNEALWADHGNIPERYYIPLLKYRNAGKDNK